MAIVDRKLWRLLRIRWSGQLTDGIFQSALASFVLFSPERQANAMSAALGFAVVLLPYSVVGPLVGTILDRYSRKSIVISSNLIRATTLIAIAVLMINSQTGVTMVALILVAFGVNRLILAGLSAGLPLMTQPQSLISANAIAVTGGSIFLVLGGGVGLGIRKIVDGFGGADQSDATLVLVAAAGYLLTAFLANLLKRREIGPHDHEMRKGSWAQGFIEMRQGFRFLEEHGDAARAIVATAINRGGITALTLAALLLERNTFHDPADSEAGLAGVSLTLSIAAIGFGIGAVIAPFAVQKYGRHRWIRYSLYLAAFGPFFLFLQRSPLFLILAGFTTALFGQCVKVTTDALVQSKIDDEYRGRVFSVYDVVVNGAIIAGAVGAALILPQSGDSQILPLAVSTIYLCGAAVLLRPSKFPPRK